MTTIICGPIDLLDRLSRGLQWLTQPAGFSRQAARQAARVTS